MIRLTPHNGIPRQVLLMMAVMAGFTKGDVEIPERLAAFMRGKKESVPMSKEFNDFKAFLMSR